MSFNMARIVGLVDSTATAIRAAAFVSLGCGAIVVVSIASRSWSTLVVVVVAAAVFLSPGLVIWDFGRSIGRLPDLPRDTLNTATGAAQSTGTALAGLRTDGNAASRVVALLKGLFSARNAVANLKGLSVAAWSLKRLASPLYLGVVVLAFVTSVAIALLALGVILLSAVTQ